MRAAPSRGRRLVAARPGLTVFIELTDHLRCTEDHPEQFLVLLPDQMEGRRVASGNLGCPVCGKVVPLLAGIADFGGGIPSTGAPLLSVDAVAAFLGLSGPGGYVCLAGSASGLAGELAERLSGIRLVVINPASGIADTDAVSVLRASRLPIKSGSMRGVVLGADLAGRPDWVTDAVRAVLPGLRMVIEGGGPPAEGVEVLGRLTGCWVGQKRG